jgi:hypothetical protein
MITQSLQKPFFLERKTDTPQVEWCPQESVLKMTGRSLPENAEAFYKPVLDWIREYIPTAAEKTILRVELEYFNSSSVKQLLSILIKLEDLRVMGKEVEVVWVYNQDDELMEMKGSELESIVELPFRFENFIL